jgi:uncharacterized SAM-binding protein YcdF (DUF218 family)
LVRVSRGHNWNVNRIELRRLGSALRRVVTAYGIALLIILYTPLTDWMAQPLMPSSDAGPSDAIILLSAWARVDGELNDSGLRRAITASELYHRGIAHTIVITGGRPTSPDAGDALEASVRFLGELGVPRSSIVVEDQSPNTRGSAVNVAALARIRGWRRLVLVTDGTHMRRTRLAFTHEGLQVTSEPTRTWLIDGDQPWLRLEKLDAIAHEYGGLLYYRARGWI